jgi:hypothetical protein
MSQLRSFLLVPSAMRRHYFDRNKLAFLATERKGL